jgi:hypothetical protein
MLKSLLTAALAKLLAVADGHKTYVAAAGLMGLAVYQLSQGEVAHAVETFLAAVAALGLRSAIAKTAPVATAVVTDIAVTPDLQLKVTKTHPD